MTLYYKLPNGTPTYNIKELITTVIDPQFLPGVELLQYNVSRCIVTNPTIEWWQELGSKTINTSQEVHEISWLVVERNIDEIRALAWSRVKERRQIVRSTGVQFSFSNGKIGTIQVKNEDITNLLAVHAAAMTATMMNDTTAILPFTDAENITHLISPSEAISLTMAAFAHGALVHTTSQTLRKNIADANTVEDIIIASTWPGDE